MSDLVCCDGAQSISRDGGDGVHLAIPGKSLSFDAPSRIVSWDVV